MTDQKQGSVQGPFTADNLPEEARLPNQSMRRYVYFNEIDSYFAEALNCLDAAHNGRLSALLNGTAQVIRATEEPPRVTDADVDRFHAQVDKADHWVAIAADRARVWQTHRPAVDPVRFALDKLHDDDVARVIEKVSALHIAGYDLADRRALQAKTFRAELAKILPVAKPWAELTDESVLAMLQKANALAWHSGDEAEREATLYASLRASLSAYAPPPRRLEVTPQVMEAFTEAWCALNEQNGQTFTNEPGYENLSRPILTAHLYSFRAALAVANTQAAARESEAVAEVERWRKMSIANRDAFAAMRNAINEHIPIQSDEADLLAGPEFSVSCEAVARAVIAEVARLRDLVEQCERKIARKDAVLAHPEIQALLNKIGFGVEPGETEVERLRSLIGDDNIAALTEGRARIIPANQAPGMPHAACHACRIGDYCESADCPNARLEIERLEGDLKQAEAQLDHANVEIGLIVSEREALKSDVERLTKERDEAIAGQDDYGARWKEAETRELRLTEELTAALAHAAALEALLTVNLGDGPVKLWGSVEVQANLSPWEVAKFVPSITWGSCLHAVSLIKGMSNCLSPSRRIRQTPAPEPELKRWKIKPSDEDVFEYIVTQRMTRADAESLGEVIGEADAW
jgi:hypothetical protein